MSEIENKKTIASRKNAEKARLAKLEKLAKQKELKKKYEPYLQDSDSSEESEEELIYYPKNEAEYKRIPKKENPKYLSENEDLRKELDEVKTYLQQLSKAKSKKVKKIIVEKEAPPTPMPSPSQPIPISKPNTELQEHMKRKILSF